MDSIEDIKEAVIMYLIHNHFALKQHIKPFTDKYNELLADDENSFFKDEIKKQYEDIIRYEVSLAAQRSLGVDPESCDIALQDLNLREFLK